MRDDSERLLDILSAINRVLAKTGTGSAPFQADEMLQVWAIHHLQIIGEACRCLSQQFRLRHPDEVWGKATGLRHLLVHHYFEIDAALVWNVIEQDLPALKEKVTTILEAFPPPAS